MRIIDMLRRMVGKGTERPDPLPPEERTSIEHAEQVARRAAQVQGRAASVRADFWRKMDASDNVLEGRKYD